MHKNLTNKEKKKQEKHMKLVTVELSSKIQNREVVIFVIIVIIRIYACLVELLQGLFLKT